MIDCSAEMSFDTARVIRMNKTVVAGLCAMVLLASCSTNKFTMQDYALTPTHVAILRNTDGVERTALNAVRMRDQGKIGLRSPRLTEHLFSTEIIRSTADPIRIQLRTTPYDDSLLSAPGVVVLISGDTTTLINERDTTTHYTPLPVGKPFLLEIKHDGAWFEILVGHTPLGLQRTSLTNTEWVLIGLPRKGNILVGDPRFNLGY